MTTLLNQFTEFGTGMLVGIIFAVLGYVILYILGCVLYFNGDKGDWDDDNDLEQENDG